MARRKLLNLFKHERENLSRELVVWREPAKVYLPSSIHRRLSAKICNESDVVELVWRKVAKEVSDQIGEPIKKISSLKNRWVL
jgi:hypothetical protein